MFNDFVKVVLKSLANLLSAMLPALPFLPQQVIDSLTSVISTLGNGVAFLNYCTFGAFGFFWSWYIVWWLAINGIAAVLFMFRLFGANVKG